MWRLGTLLLIVFAFASATVEAELAPEFTFSKEADPFVCADRRPVPGGSQESGAYVLTRQESKTFPGSDVPVLTVTSDPSSTITIVGKKQSDFSIQYCGHGSGANETDARERLRSVSMTLNGNVVSFNNAARRERLAGARAFLEAPSNALTVTHATDSSVEVRNMTGPVHVAAARARATILNTAGDVDVQALNIDFAAARGRVALVSEGSIRLALPAKFEGSLRARAVESVRMQVPSGFQTPFRVSVNHAEDFVCRPAFCSKIKKTTQGEVVTFTYPGDGSAPELFQLSAGLFAGATPRVVIDTIADETLKNIDTGPLNQAPVLRPRR